MRFLSRLLRKRTTPSRNGRTETIAAFPNDVWNATEAADLTSDEATKAFLEIVSSNGAGIDDRERVRLAMSYIKAGADMTAVGPYTETTLMLAVNTGLGEIVQAMVHNGANVNTYGSGAKTALYKAVAEGHLDIARFLVERGADVNILCSDGATPLAMAAINGYTELAIFLMEKGADAEWRTPYGTAEEVALAQGYRETAKAIAKAKRKRRPSRIVSCESNPPEHYPYNGHST